MENIDVVEPHRGCTLACRGFVACRASMSWVTSMSWECVVEHMLFQGHVAGADVVCRGTRMSWRCVVENNPMSWVVR